jgi:uncharacterized protein (DUF1501 family)
MTLSRRSFLKGATASAVLAGTHVLGFASRALAAGPNAPILVLVNLAGGSDGLGTVIPLDDVGAPQRSRYQSLRPKLAVPLSALSRTTIDPDPVRRTGLALHPSMTGLHSVYREGRLAVVLGAGLAGSSLSHFEAEKAWFFGRPDVLVDTRGWVGRQLDAAADGRPHAVSFGNEVSPTLQGSLPTALGIGSVAGFALPDDPLWQWRDGAVRGAALAALLAEPRLGLAERVASQGRLLVDQADFLADVETTGWGSALEAESFELGRDLREIASLIRYDTLHPGAPSGFRFYHVRQSGFDTHSRQGATDASFGQPKLLTTLSRALSGFQRDLDAIGASSRVLTLVYSEFGRRVAQNANGADAGTDHGAAGVLMLMGSGVVGGVHGALPRLDQLDATGNLVVSTDFRNVYAAVIDDWLGGDHSAVLPGGPFPKLGVIRA